MPNESFTSGGAAQLTAAGTAAQPKLAGLKAQIAGPLIGTRHFADLAIAQCEGAARREGTDAAAVRYRGVARAIVAMTNAPFAVHTVATLANTAGMSRSSFAQCFAATYGLGPLAFLKTERMRFAAHLLVTTSLSVKVVSLQVGYKSFSYFSRAFRAKFGIAPSEVTTMAASESSAMEPSALIAGPFPRSSLPDDALSPIQLKLICEAVLDVMWAIDLASGRVWWNEGVSRVFGYGAGEAGPDTAWGHAHLHPDDRQRVIDGMRRARAAGGLLWQDEFRFRKADGRYAHVVGRGVIERNSEGVAVRFIGVMHDVSKFVRE